MMEPWDLKMIQVILVAGFNVSTPLNNMLVEMGSIFPNFQGEH